MSSIPYYQFKFRPYSRLFKQPLQTHHGLWQVRQGILLQLTDSTGQVGWGEIAPLEWFGTESLEQALEFCRSLPSEITPEAIAQIPDTLPTCQFGFEAARERIEPTIAAKSMSSPPLSCSHLLPTGLAALQAWQAFPQPETQTFKWKIGVAPIEEELVQFQQLMQVLPETTRLRLDANGGLTSDQAGRWLKECDALRLNNPSKVEFLEQPLPVEQFNEMLGLSQQFATPIALDESVATLPQLEDCYQQGWREIFVIKAAIAGSPRRLREFCNQHPVDLVWSSVFETPIAQHFIQHHLIPSIPRVTSAPRAIGFGVNQWFTESHLDQLGQWVS